MAIPGHVLTETLDNVIEKIKRSKRKKLAVWDIDNTIFHSPADAMLIRVVDRITGKPLLKNGKPVVLTTREFADKPTLEKALGKNGALVEPASFNDFRNAGIFVRYATAIKENMARAKRDYTNSSMFFMVLTARGNMDDKKIFLKHFRDNGLNMDTSFSHIVRAAAVSDKGGGAAKRAIIEEILTAVPDINFVSLWDDSKDNISEFKQIKDTFPSRKLTLEPHLIAKS